VGLGSPPPHVLPIGLGEPIEGLPPGVTAECLATDPNGIAGHRLGRGGSVAHLADCATPEMRGKSVSRPTGAGLIAAPGHSRIA
jgi:hypothetical protein